MKENILFGQPFDPEKYNAVVFACALEQVVTHATCQGFVIVGILPGGNRSHAKCIADFMAHFTMGIRGHYITMLPVDWSIYTSHDPLPSSCHSEKMLWNPSMYNIPLYPVYMKPVTFIGNLMSKWPAFYPLSSRIFRCCPMGTGLRWGRMG